MRKDMKIGLLIGSAIVFVGWGMFSLLSETPQKRRQDQFAGKMLSISPKHIETPPTPTAQPEPSAAPQTDTSTATETIHIVRPEETLSSIAALHFGKSSKWKQILDANKDTLQSPTQLKPGMRLKIPTAK